MPVIQEENNRVGVKAWNFIEGVKYAIGELTGLSAEP
jgi:hypothetical protein